MNALRLLVPAPLRPAVRGMRRFVRSWRTVVHDAPLDPTDLRATVAVDRAVPLAESARPTEVRFTVTNHSPFPVAGGGSHPVGVLVNWRTFTGEPCGVRDGFARLPGPLWP